MQITVSRRAAALLSTWLVLAGLVLALLAALLNALAALLGFLVWSVLAMLLGTLYFSSYKLYLGKHHVSVRHGILFLFTHRMPLRFITGCHIICSPVQRRTGSCVLVLLSSGGSVLVPGAPLAAAQQLAERIAADARGG